MRTRLVAALALGLFSAVAVTGCGKSEEAANKLEAKELKAPKPTGEGERPQMTPAAGGPGMNPNAAGGQIGSKAK